ncbi:MAG: hypothetical protein KDB27_33800 [Planctomycetales bacterium]|nr:hypothetical protein [Planctomycetales bacterium]
MDLAATNHVLYLVCSAAFTIFTGQSLFANGRPFLMECFRNAKAADATNRLFLIGFYLLNTAFVCITLRFGETGTTAVATIELLSTRVGVVVLTMGIMHFNNLYWCNRIRNALLTR